MIPRVYLAGPIDHCSVDETHKWRVETRDRYHMDAMFIDPCRRMGWGDMTPKNIVYLDKADIAIANVLLANCWKPGWGTAQEILWAHERGKIVVCVVPDTKDVSPWVTIHSTYVTDSIENAMEWIKKYFDNLHVNDIDRDEVLRNC